MATLSEITKGISTGYNNVNRVANIFSNKDVTLKEVDLWQNELNNIIYFFNGNNYDALVIGMIATTGRDKNIVEFLNLSFIGQYLLKTGNDILSNTIKHTFYFEEIEAATNLSWKNIFNSIRNAINNYYKIAKRSNINNYDSLMGITNKLEAKLNDVLIKEFDMIKNI